MYEMYPDSWGPAKHAHHRDDRTDTGRAAGAAGAAGVQHSLDPRDDDGLRPDDN